MIFGEICVRESQTALQILVLHCQTCTATDFFTKTSGKCNPLCFQRGSFLQFLAFKKVT